METTAVALLLVMTKWIKSVIRVGEREPKLLSSNSGQPELPIVCQSKFEYITDGEREGDSIKSKTVPALSSKCDDHQSDRSLSLSLSPLSLNKASAV